MGDRTRVIILDADYDASMDVAVGRIFDEFRIDWRGKKVLVKPNILAPYKPDEGVTTHPFLVKAALKRLLDEGADAYVGDSPGLSGYGISDRAAKTTGMLDVAGDRYINLGRKAVKHYVGSKRLDHVMLSGDVLEADIVVNLPKMKTHGLTLITGAIKNTFGYVLGGDKMRLHSISPTPIIFAEVLLDVYRTKPPQLNIMDAVVAMEGAGPTKGPLRKVGKLIASDNAVSLDAVFVRMIGKNISSIPIVDMAGKNGLGETDISKLKIIGDMHHIPEFKLPATFVPGLVGLVMNRFLAKWTNCVPEVLDDKCKKCGICLKHCPVEAMQMCGDYPKADLDACIHCYCCQEMCPEGAINLRGRFFRWVRGAYNPGMHNSK